MQAIVVNQKLPTIAGHIPPSMPKGKPCGIFVRKERESSLPP
ncbi:hypothetical protein SDC9_198662 [bioreactor metagenome]|uniref:Uncharacterized protein n=1 Tax=bioreactor metagenome TaxID=1076179 RepID=A0A645IIA7_9ZZZZ